MKKWVLGLLPGLCACLLAAPAMASSIANLIDDKDEACVAACLNRKAECKPADRIKCQEDCRTPIKTTMVIGNNVIEVDRTNPEEEYKLVTEYQRQLGVDPKQYATYVTTFNYNPLADLGIELPLFQYVNILPFGIDPPIGEGVETVVYMDRISCTYPVNRPLPLGGGFGAGCREKPEKGVEGSWGALGCPQTQCCYKPGPSGAAGYGTCTVGSTYPGDGIY